MSEQVVESTELDRYECRACGYVYEPEKGDDSHNIPAGTAFAELPITWRCPVCTAKKKAFENVGPAGTASGFSENLGYGLGVNKLTPGQKNILIFGALALGFLFFISLYGLK
ncbi:rubredoxin [Calothrix sp. CCY 0018]|uniref:rubredoxin n=1 Tax=Calothrix sp. CCY 0018 TaxID=3103864 RepID=UPI0039C6D9DB